MSTEEGHIEFDELLREKFEGAETLSSHENWDKLNLAINRGANDSFDTIIKNRFDKELLASNVPLDPSIGDANRTKKRRRLLWLLLLLLVTIPPMAYNYFKRSNNISHTKEVALQRQSPDSKSKQQDKEGETEQVVAQEAIKTKQLTDTQIANAMHVPEERETQTNLNKISSPSSKKQVKGRGREGGTIKKKFKRSKEVLENVPESGTQHKLKKEKIPPTSLNKQSAVSRNKEAKNRADAKSMPKEDKLRNDMLENLKSVNPSTTVQEQEKRKQLKGLTKREQERPLSKADNEIQAERSSLDQNKINEMGTKRNVLDTSSHAVKADEKPKAKKSLPLKQNTVYEKITEQSAADTSAKSSRFSISLGVLAQRPSARLKSSNSILQTLYENGEIKKWNLSAELQASYKLNKKWSIGAAMSMSSYATEIGKSNFEKEAVSNIEMDTTNKTVKFISSMGTSQLNNLDDFEFGRIPAPSQPDPLNKFSYSEKQSFKMIQIPIFLQYRSHKGRLQYSLATGPLVSFVTSSSATMELYNTAFPSDILVFDHSNQTNKLLWGATSRIGLHYDLSKSIGIQLSPSFNYTFSDLSTSSLFSIHPYNFNIPFGLTYKF